MIILELAELCDSYDVAVCPSSKAPPASIRVCILSMTFRYAGTTASVVLSRKNCSQHIAYGCNTIRL